MSEAYITIPVIVRGRTAKGVKLSPVAEPDHAAWIGRSCIHGADDMEIDACKIGDELDVRMFDWVARKEGFV